jgi:hypothetical protein
MEKQQAIQSLSLLLQMCKELQKKATEVQQSQQASQNKADKK